MFIVSKRLSHNTKVWGGNLIGKLLKFLFDRGQGPASRLHRVFSPTRSSNHWVDNHSDNSKFKYKVRTLTQSTYLKLAKPQFCVNDSNTKSYLQRIANYEQRLTDSAGIITASNVDVSLPIGMHLWQGQIFEDALLGNRLLTNPKYVLDLELLPLKSKTKLPEAVLLSMPWHHNFFHWMIEILPRLKLYELAEDLHHLKLIVPKSSPGFVQESLRLTGYLDKVDFVEDDAYRFETLHILSKLAQTSDVTPSAIAWLTEQFRIQNPAGPRKRLYISRADAGIRYVTNEATVQKRLAQYGFETVVMSQHSLAAQIQLFAQAEIVVGSHGAAFANVAFMPPGSVLIELFQAGHFNHCFYRMANLKNLQYGFLVGQQQGPGFAINPEHLDDLLQQALSSLTLSTSR